MALKIGVFDSGLGGLTIVKTMLSTIKGIEVYYVADSKHAPYGDKTKAQILTYSNNITNYLIKTHNIDILVVACNTATSASIDTLRATYPNLPIIGTEPGINPAMKQTQSKKVGILATPATLNGEKYKTLLKTLCDTYHVDVFEQACGGLVEQIEAGETESEKTLAMLEKWLHPMREKGVDSIVLGCTHYPLVSHAIQEIMQNKTLHLIEVSEPITRRVQVLLKDKNHTSKEDNKLFIYATGEINKSMVNRIVPSFDGLEMLFIG